MFFSPGTDASATAAMQVVARGARSPPCLALITGLLSLLSDGDGGSAVRFAGGGVSWLLHVYPL